MGVFKDNLIDFDSNLHLTVDSLIGRNNIITGSNNIALRRVDVKPCGFSKMYMYKDLIEDKFYQSADQFSEKKKKTHLKVYSLFLNKINPFYEENEKKYKIMFANNDEIMKVIK